jgi:hypothetical protein
MEDSYYTDGSGDRKTFRIHVSNTSAMYLGAKIDWTEDETYFDVSIGDTLGNTLAISYDANKTSYTSASAIADMDGGTDFYVFVYSHDLWHELPCNFTLIVMAWEALPAPTLAFNWYSADAPARTSITTGGVATGDHVVMNATWTDAPLTNMPDYGITTLEMKILYGSLVERTGDLIIPDGSYDPFSGPIDLSQFAWRLWMESVKAIMSELALVSLTVTVTSWYSGTIAQTMPLHMHTPMTSWKVTWQLERIQKRARLLQTRMVQSLSVSSTMT